MLNWVGETFASLGAGFDTEDEPTTEAKRYYEKSAATFETILQKVDLSPQLRTQIPAQDMFDLLVLNRQYEPALGTLQKVLASNTTALDAQVKAAETLQRAGRFASAISGAYPQAETKKNLVWGWGRIAQITARYAQFKQIFHQARFQLAECRFQQALRQQGAERTRLLNMAQRGHLVDGGACMGWETNSRVARYDALLKRIQTAAGGARRGIAGRR